MTFDLETWPEKVKAGMRGLRDLMRGAGIKSVYASTLAVALWPLVDAYQRGDLKELSDLGFKFAGDVAKNLLASDLFKWKDEADGARKLANAVKDPEVRDGLDAIVEKIDAIRIARDALNESDRTWFVEKLRDELASLGNLSKYEVVLGDYSASAIGTGAKAGTQEINAPVGGDVLGPWARKEVHHHGQAGSDPAVLRTAYLNRLFELASIVPLSGVDPKAASSESEARLNLAAVYTALRTLTSEVHEHLILRDPAEREVRRISALEQLNLEPRLVLLGEPGSGKSTFVSFVAICLSGELLGRNDANLALLTSPLPQDDDEWRARREKENKPRPQPWDHGALLPVRVILRDFAARGLPVHGNKATANDLWEFIAEELRSAALADYAPFLKAELLKNGGLIMLDGLDEVPGADVRREQVKQAIEDFRWTFQRCRLLVTSRTYAYQRQDWRLPSFTTEAVLAPLTPGQIRTFVDRWYAHIAPLRGLDPENAQGRAELLKRAIFSRDRLQTLAERPLLLTLMASLHAWRGGELPGKREQLYADVVDLLLDWWEKPKTVRDREGNVRVLQPSLAEWLKADREKMRAVLNELAYMAQATQPELADTADVPEHDLVKKLMGITQNPEVDPARLVEYLRDRAGLLLPRGVGVYTFAHPTFQEYLAACYLTDYDYPDKLAELARSNPNRWREVALLAAAKAARGVQAAVWYLVEALCYREPEDPQSCTEDAWGAHLAGQVLVETVDLRQINQRDKPKADRVQRWLVHILKTGSLPALERARVGDNLAHLGDPRFNADAWYLPKEGLLGFVKIPDGPFLMGTREADLPSLMEQLGGTRDWYEHEMPQREIDLPGYYIAKYPVTVAQFREFVKNKGYKPRDEDCLSGLPNHPVVNVSWHDALAYGDWLTETLKKRPDTPEPLATLLREKGWKITLPSEAEWEKAARGPNGLVYPWGDEFDPNKANTDETKIGTTSAVGCFPEGKSPYEILDMSGNVWEWTRSLWGKDLMKLEFGYPYDPGDRRRESLKAPDKTLRVLRGGSFFYLRRLARCAFRHWFSPRNGFRDIGFRVVASPF